MSARARRSRAAGRGASGPTGAATLGAYNTAAWAAGDYVADYSGTEVATVEAILIARHRDALTGPVLELGCGAGRLTRVLAAISDEVHAIDVSPRMVEACRRAVPRARAEVGDLRDLSGTGTGTLGAVVGSGNVLGILDHAERPAVLAELRRVLRPDGLLLFSAHNRAHLPLMADPSRVFDRTGTPLPRALARAAYRAARLPARRRNRRLTRGYERETAEYVVLNDGAHDNRLAHYYIGRDAQERQLAAAGFDLLECLDGVGVPVAAGQEQPASSNLHYVARPRG